MLKLKNSHGISTTTVSYLRHKKTVTLCYCMLLLLAATLLFCVGGEKGGIPYITADAAQTIHFSVLVLLYQKKK